MPPLPVLLKRYGIDKAFQFSKAVADAGFPNVTTNKPDTNIGYFLDTKSITATTPSEQYAQAQNLIRTKGVTVVETPKPKRTSFLQDLGTGLLRTISLGTSAGSSISGLAQGFQEVDKTIIPEVVGGYKPMGIFDSNDGIFGNSGGLFGSGVSFSDVFNLGTSVASQFIHPPSASPAFFPTSPSPSVGSVVPALASVPAVISAGGAVGRSLFTRYPNLAASIQSLRSSGRKVSRGQLYSALKRFGPTALTGIGLSAAAVSELAVAGPGRRRMNPANSKALRRAARRITSFHKLCRTTDMLHRPRKRH